MLPEHVHPGNMHDTRENLQSLLCVWEGSVICGVFFDGGTSGVARSRLRQKQGPCQAPHSLEHLQTLQASVKRQWKRNVFIEGAPRVFAGPCCASSRPQARRPTAWKPSSGTALPSRRLARAESNASLPANMHDLLYHSTSSGKTSRKPKLLLVTVTFSR
jgi:hypothetical protein